MKSKTVKFINYESLSRRGDRSDYIYFFSIIDTDMIGQPDERTSTKKVEIVIGISRALERSWELSKIDLEKVLFEYSKRHIRNKVFDDLPVDHVELFLESYNYPQECPFDPSKIDITFGQILEFEVSEQTLPKRMDSIEHTVNKNGKKSTSKKNVLPILLFLLGIIITIVSNVASSLLPPSFQPYLGLSWPLLGILIVISIILLVKQGKSDT